MRMFKTNISNFQDSFRAFRGPFCALTQIDLFGYFTEVRFEVDKISFKEQLHYPPNLRAEDSFSKILPFLVSFI